MIPGQPGGMPPQATPPMGEQDAISKNRSVMNPVDMAAMSQNGTVRPGMKVVDLLNMWKVAPEDPVEKLVEAIKLQGQNKTNVGKMQAMATPQGSAMGPRNGTGPNGAMANRMPQGRPSAVPQPSQQGQRPQQGLADLMG